MNYAFIFGTNVYLSDKRTVSYADTETRIDFLKILSDHHQHAGRPDYALTIDAHFQTSNDGDEVKIESNVLHANDHISIDIAPNRVRVYHKNHAEPILDVFQLDEHEYSVLSSHITNEIEAQQPKAVITIKADIKVEGHHIIADNEKLFVNGDSYATGVTNAHEGVSLTPYGVLS